MHIKKIQALALAVAITACPAALSSCTGVRTSPTPTRQGTTQIGQNLGYRGLTNQGTGTGMGMTRTGTGMATGTGTTTGTATGLGTPMGTTGTTMTADAQKGARIQSELKRMMPQLKDVNALVVGSTALIGYKTTGKAGASVTKDSIAKAVKKIDPSITTVESTKNSALVSSLRKMADDVANRRPITNLGMEFSKLRDRIRTAK